MLYMAVDMIFCRLSTCLHFDKIPLVQKNNGTGMSIPMIVSNRKTKLPPNMSDKNNMTRGYINNIGPYIDDLNLPFISTSKDGFSIKIKVYRKTILQG